MPHADVETFAAAARAAKRKVVTFESVATGGHRQPMVDVGIPRAIAWAKHRMGK